MKRPTIVTLCGSTKFKQYFTQAQLEETLAGKIVLTIGCSIKDDNEIFNGKYPLVTRKWLRLSKHHAFATWLRRHSTTSPVSSSLILHTLSFITCVSIAGCIACTRINIPILPMYSLLLCSIIFTLSLILNSDINTSPINLRVEV